MAERKLTNGQPLLKSISFEPDPVEAAKLASSSNDLVLHYALGAIEEERVLYLTKARRCSSCLEPNFDLLRNFPEVERFEVEECLSLRTHSVDGLDTRKLLPQTDFAKLDVQGLELDVLQGGAKYFSACLIGLEIEVEFQPIYKNQPLFGSVDAFVTKYLDMELRDLQRHFLNTRKAGDLDNHVVKLSLAMRSTCFLQKKYWIKRKLFSPWMPLFFV